MVNPKVDCAVEALPEPFGCLRDLDHLSGLDHRCFRALLLDLHHHWLGGYGLDAEQRATMNGPVLCFYYEFLRALHASHLRPLQRHRSIDIVEADRENPVLQAFNFASEPIPILHNHHVVVVSRETRCCKEQGRDENKTWSNYPDVHGEFHRSQMPGDVDDKPAS